jgi:hypothetical protein
VEGAFGRHATNPRSAPSSEELREAAQGIRTAFRADGLLFSFLGPSDRFFERASSGSVGRYQAWAYSSVGLERTPDKREVGGSNPPRPTSSGDELDGAVAQLVERQLCKLDVVGSTPISSTRKEAGPRVPRPRQ